MHRLLYKIKCSIAKELTLPPLTISAWMRYDLIYNALKSLTNINSILEIGTGEGGMGVRLANRFTYKGLEIDKASYEITRNRLRKYGFGIVLNNDISVLKKSERFDLVCAFEVLEHIKNDEESLITWREHIRKNGWLLFSVPAFQSRYGEADKKVGHYRRYDKDVLIELLTRSGFNEPKIYIYGFPFGFFNEPFRNFLARLSMKKMAKKQRTLSSGRWLQPSKKLNLITYFGSLPFRLAQKPFTSSSFGVGWVILAQRKN